MDSKLLKKLFSFYSYLIVLLVFLLCLCVWPLRLFGHTIYENTSSEEGIFPNLELSGGEAASGQFYPAHARLESISFQFLSSGSAKDGKVTLSLTDIDGTPICETTLTSGDIMNYRWISFPIEQTLSTDNCYVWSLQAQDYEDASLALYTGSPLIGPEAELTDTTGFYYNWIPYDNLTCAIRFSYTDKIDSAHKLAYWAAFVLFGMLLYAACRRIETMQEDVK